MAETEGKDTKTEEKETVDDASLDGSKVPFNPHQSGPEESHVAVESEELDLAVHLNDS